MPTFSMADKTVSHDHDLLPPVQCNFYDIIISMFCCLPEDKTVVRLVNIVDGSKDIVDNPKSRDKT